MVCMHCGKSIWGEGYDPLSGVRFYSHVHDNQETCDGKDVKPLHG